MASFVALPALVRALVLRFLGAPVAPGLCVAAAGIVPASALQQLQDLLESATSPCHDLVFMMGASLQLPFLFGCRSLCYAISQAFAPVVGQLLFYPGFHETARGSLVLPSLLDTESPESFAASAASLPPEPEPFDLCDYLAESGLPDDPLDAWIHLNRDNDEAAAAISLLQRTLQSGDFDFRFYPADGESDREAVIIVSFRVFEIVGAFVAQEPFVDPAGFYM